MKALTIRLVIILSVCAIFCACSNQDEPAPVVDPVEDVQEVNTEVFNSFERSLAYTMLRKDLQCPETEANFALMPTVMSQYFEVDCPRNFSNRDEMGKYSMYCSDKFHWRDTIYSYFEKLYRIHSQAKSTHFQVFNIWPTNIFGNLEFVNGRDDLVPFTPDLCILNNQYLSNEAIEEQLKAYRLQYLNPQNIQAPKYEFLKSENPITLDNSIVQSSILNLQLAWKNGFSTTTTKKFTNEDGSQAEVEYLHAPLYEAKHFANEYFECVALPLTDTGLEFCLIKRPSNGIMNPVVDFFGDQVAVKLKETMPELIELSIPRFEVTTDRYLNALLATMGVTDYFSQRESYLIRSDDFLTGVHAIHQGIHLELTQDGNEMAAKGSAPVLSEGTPVAKVEMDRAFMFFLVDTQSGIPLLGGAIRQL